MIKPTPGARYRAKKSWRTFELEMKAVLLLAGLFVSMISHAQESACESSAYRIHSSSSLFPQLEIKVDGVWKFFPLTDEHPENFHFECREAELSGSGSAELVIIWSNAVYGSGGGTIVEGIQIWDLDAGKRLFNEITSCSDENFGRGGSEGYFSICKKQIVVSQSEIKINEKICHTEWSENEIAPDPIINCPLTALNEGVYFFRNGELIRKQ